MAEVGKGDVATEPVELARTGREDGFRGRIGQKNLLAYFKGKKGWEAHVVEAIICCRVPGSRPSFRDKIGVPEAGVESVPVRSPDDARRLSPLKTAQS
jgi:hypothetical protein